MAIKQEFTTLLAKKMDRKDFLKYVGIAIVATSGLGAAIKALGNSADTSSQTHKPASSSTDYGNSTYGL